MFSGWFAALACCGMIFTVGGIIGYAQKQIDMRVGHDNVEIGPQGAHPAIEGEPIEAPVDMLDDHQEVEVLHDQLPNGNVIS